MRVDPNRLGAVSNSSELTLPRPEPASSSTETKEGRRNSSPGAVRAPGSDPAAPDIAELENAVEKMNKAVRIFNQALQFEVTKSNRIVIRVIDQDSGEVIRQIPPEEFIDNFHKVADALGVLIDRRV